MFPSRARSSVPVVLVLVLGVLPATQPLCDTKCAEAAAAERSESHCPSHTEDLPQPGSAPDGCAHGEDARHAVAAAPHKTQAVPMEAAPALAADWFAPVPPVAAATWRPPDAPARDNRPPPAAGLPLRI